MLAEFESGTLAQYLELIKAGEIKDQQFNAAGVLDHALHASGIGMLESSFREYFLFTNPD